VTHIKLGCIVTYCIAISRQVSPSFCTCLVESQGSNLFRRTNILVFIQATYQEYEAVKASVCTLQQAKEVGSCCDFARTR
jgi:hypothetical protein